MFQRPAIASLVALTTVFASGAYAADQAAAPPPKMTAAQGAATQDAGKLSADGAAAFRDLHMTRLAIFDADPAQAKSLIAKAQAELTKAKTDETVFTKAESELKQPAGAKTAAANPAPANNPDATKPVAWLPVDGELTLDDDFVATPQKAAAVQDANKSLSAGDQKGAIDKLKLADVNVNFTLAVVPLVKTTNDVDQAATLIGEGKYYEANAMLKQAENGMRFDEVDVNGVPTAQKTAGASAATTTAGTPTPTKSAK